MQLRNIFGMVNDLKALDSKGKKEYFLRMIDNCDAKELHFLKVSLESKMVDKAIDFISHLPSELSIKILSYLKDSPKSLYSANLVNRKWAGIISDNDLWRKMCIFNHWCDFSNPAIVKQKRYKKMKANQIKKRDYYLFLTQSLFTLLKLCGRIYLSIII
jgi:hypothetical protein